MGLIPDRVAQILNDKMADLWSDIFAAEQPAVEFYEEVTLTDDENVEMDVGPGADIVDANLAAGLQLYQVFYYVMSGLRSHVSGQGGYTMATYLTARNWRFHRFAGDRMWHDSGLATNSALGRSYVCPELTGILRKIQGGASTYITGIPATAGSARMRPRVAVKGAAPWTPDVYSVLETPASTLSAAIDNAVTTIPVTDSSEFPAAGFCYIGSEAITYAANTGTSLTGAARGQYGTVAAAHVNASPVYCGMTAQPVLSASAQVGHDFDLWLDRVTSISPAGAATTNATGVAAAGLLDGMTILMKDQSCPELLTADTNADEIVLVSDTSAFRPGDYCMLGDDGAVGEEWCQILDVDHYNSIITLTANCVGNFQTANSAFIALAFGIMNEGGVFAWNDAAGLTLVDSTGFPTAGTVLVEDEEITFTGNAANDLTGLGRGANGTTAVDHPDGLPVLLVQEGTFPGHNEFHTVNAVAANAFTTDDNLLHSHYTAGFFVICFRELVQAVDGAGGNAGDDITIYAHPDRLISKAG